MTMNEWKEKANNKLGGKRIKETKTCVLIGITWKMCKCCETTWALHKSKKWDFGVFERQDLMRICKALCCEKHKSLSNLSLEPCLNFVEAKNNLILHLCLQNWSPQVTHGSHRGIRGPSLIISAMFVGFSATSRSSRVGKPSPTEELYLKSCISSAFFVTRIWHAAYVMSEGKILAIRHTHSKDVFNKRAQTRRFCCQVWMSSCITAPLSSRRFSTFKADIFPDTERSWQKQR